MSAPVTEPLITAPPVADPVMMGPGTVKRWSRRAWALVARGLIAWFLYMVAVSVLLFYTQPYYFVQEIVTALSYFVAVGIAALVDRGARVPGTLPHALFAYVVRNWKGMLHMLAVVLLLATIVQILFGAFTGQGMVVSRLYQASFDVSLALLHEVPMTAVRETFGPALAFFCLAMLMMSVPFATSLLQYHCMTLLDLPWGTAYRASDDAMEVNLGALLPVSGLLVIMPLALLMLAPIFAPLYFCYAASLTYAAFRDIYPLTAADAAVEIVREDT